MRTRLLLSLILGLLATGCTSQKTPSITLATTTSVQDTGLLDVLTPKFGEETGIEVKVVAVGTGAALELARRNDADVLIVHDPESEQRFMDEGHGESRRQIMHNDFVLVGPPNDPAVIAGETSAVEAMKRIATKEATFISRGDESGTHLREKSLWKKAGITSQANWYIEGGAGMGAVLRMASEKRAYTLSDRGTFLALRDKLDLKIMHEGDPLLLNRYSVIVVRADKHPADRHAWAKQFAEFLLAPKTQALIGKFGVERFGQPLFIPDASDPK
jgi:tungstate transport system substrate-binding protein